MKIVLVNDTSLYENHFGCQLVGQTIREHLAEFGMELLAALPYTFDPTKFTSVFEQADLLLINGEGSIHHGKNRMLCDLAKLYPSVLINAVFQENPDDFAVGAFKRVFVRESNSAKYLDNYGVKAAVVPDLIFGSRLLRSVIKCEPEFDLGRTDRVGDESVGLIPNTGNPYIFVRDIMKYKRVAAGRFHAAVLCAIFDIPFATWDSNSWKTDGMMKDMGVPHLHFRNADEALQNVPPQVQPTVREFAMEAPSRIQSMFAEIKQVGIDCGNRTIGERMPLTNQFSTASNNLILPPRMREVRQQKRTYLDPLRKVKRAILSLTNR